MENVLGNNIFQQQTNNANKLGNGKLEWSDLWNAQRQIYGTMWGGTAGAIESITDPVLAAYYHITGQGDKALKVYSDSWSQKIADTVKGDTVDYSSKFGQGIGKYTNFLGSMSEQVSRMAIAVGVAAITGGASVAATGATAGASLLKSGAFKVASNSLLGLTSFGHGMQNAAQTTGELGLKEYIYGLGSAAIEFGTEKMWDVGGLVGGGWLDNATKKLTNKATSTILGSLALNFGSEFVEEATSEILDAPLSKLTIDANAKVDWKNVLSAGIQGGLGGLLMGGSSTIMTQKANTKVGNTIIENNNVQSTIEKGKKLGVDYADYLENRQVAGREVSPTQIGKLAGEIDEKILKNSVEEVKTKYGISESKAIKKYADEIAYKTMYSQGGSQVFLNKNSTGSDGKAIDTYLQNGGNIDDMATALRLANKKSDRVVLEYNTANHNGYYNNDDGSIGINLASDKFKTQTASHEVTHGLDENSKIKIYRTIENTKWFKDNAEKIIEQYKKVEPNETQEYYNEEVVARFMEQAIDNPKYLLQQIEGDTNVLTDIVNHFKGLKKFEKTFSKEDKQALNTAYNIYRDALTEQENRPYKMTDGAKGKLGLQYSLSDNAKDDVEKVLKNKYYTEDVRLTDNTPSIITSQKGTRNLPMLMKASHIRENILSEKEAREMGLKIDKTINYHGLGEPLFLDTISDLEDVTLAYRGTKNASDSSRRENYFLLISQHTNAQGDVINVPVYINEVGQYNRVFIDTNKVATVFGREDIFAYIRQEIDNGNLVRIKNKSTSSSELTSPINASYKRTASDTYYAQNSEKVNTLDKNSSNKHYDAKETYKKSYTKAEANKLVDESLAVESFGEDIISINGKGRISDAVYKRMNNVDYQEREVMASRFADYIVNNAFSTNVDLLDSLQSQRDVLSFFKENVRRRIDLTFIAGEIKYKYDKSASGIMLAWSKKGGMSIDKFVHDYQSELSALGINIESNNSADIFFELYDNYLNARNDIAKMTKREVLKVYSSEEIANIKNEIKEQVLKAYETKGKIDSDLAKLIKANQKLREINNKLYKKATNLQTANEMAVAITKLSTEAKEYGKRGYSASVLKNEEWSSVMTAASKIVYRNKINVENTRNFFNALSKLYTVDRLTAGGESFYDKTVGENIQFLCETLNKVDSPTQLTKDQLKAIKGILQGLKHLYKTFDTVVINDRRVATRELSENGIQEYNVLSDETKNKFLDFMTKNACDTRSYLRYMSGYNENSVVMQLFNNLTKAESNTNIMKMELNKPFEDFYNKNKGYARRLKKATIELTAVNKQTGQSENVQLPLDIAMQLYLTARDNHAKLGLYAGGFNYVEKNTLKEYVPTESDVLALKDKFSNEDKEYMNLAHTFFNKDARKLKVDTDYKVLGYTNISEDSTNYIPIRRDSYSIAKNFDTLDSYIEDFNSVYNTSINKERVKGTKSAIAMNGLPAVISRHTQQVTMYAAMYEAVTAMNRVINYNVTNDSSNVNSLLKQLDKRSFGFKQYYDKLMLDVLGNKKTKDAPAKVIEYIRSAFAKSTLGANIKVMASQFSSYPMASIYITPKNLAKGMGNKVSKATVYENCKFLEVRNNNKTIIKAEGMIDKVGKAGEVLMTPISKVDDFTVRKIFEAACYECAEKNGSKLFSKENYSQASELTEKVVRETQPMFSDIERSALQRSDNELVKLFTMFTSATQKQLSRLMDGIGEYSFAKQSKASKEVVSEARAKMSRSLMSVTSSAFLYTALGLAIKYALGREDDEKTLMQNFFTDFGGAITGMVPFMRDVYSYYVNGYESENFLDNTINNTLGGVKQMYKMLDSVVSGEKLTTEQIVAPIKRIMFAFGQLSGTPVRNISNQIEGILTKYFGMGKQKQIQQLNFNNLFAENMFDNNMFENKFTA